MSSKGGNIRLHPKHGLNPTLPVCNWCGEPTGEIALLGNAYKQKAAMRMVLNDVPCAKCQDMMREGVTIIEKESERTTSKRTGRWCVMTEEAVKRIFAEPFTTQMLLCRASYITPDIANQIGLFDTEVTSEGES